MLLREKRNSKRQGSRPKEKTATRQEERYLSKGPCKESRFGMLRELIEPQRKHKKRWESVKREPVAFGLKRRSGWKREW